MDTPTLICPNCGNILAPDNLFCPKCGTKVEINQHIGVGKQIYVYFVSLFLPPFGLIWTWKYLKASSPQIRYVGIAALILTVVGIGITIWTTMGFLQGMQAQLNTYSNLGL